MVIEYVSSKDSEEIHTMRTETNNIAIMMGHETDKIINETVLPKYQQRLEAKMKGSEFGFDSVDLSHYKLHKTL